MRNDAIKFTIFYIFVLTLMVSFIDSIMAEDVESSLHVAKRNCVVSDTKKEAEQGSEQKKWTLCNESAR